MENKFIENKIKSTFDSYQPELDNDAIWENIEPQLTKKKDRKYFIFWFCLVGLAFSFWFFNQGSHSTIEESNMILTEKTDVTPSKKMVEPILETSLDPSEIVAIPVKNKVETSTSKNKTISSIKKRSIEATTILNDNILSKGQDIHFQIKEPKVEFPNWNTDLISAKSIALMGLEIAATNYLQQIDIAKINKEQKRKRKQIKPIRKNKWDIIFQSTIAPVFPIKTLSQRTNGSASYLNRRKKAESQLEGFGINLNIQIQNRKGFVIMTGLEYQQFNEKFEEDITSEITEINTGPVIIFENAAGEIIETINGPIVTTTNTERRKRRFNNYRFINMPIGIGRAWKNKKSFYKFSGGIQYNILFAFSGEILSPVSDFTYTGDFKNKIGFGLWLAGEYSRAVNDRLKWVIAPKIQMPLQSITADNYELNQRYFPISLNVGINYLLNPKRKKNRINQHKKN